MLKHMKGDILTQTTVFRSGLEFGFICFEFDMFELTFGTLNIVFFFLDHIFVILRYTLRIRVTQCMNIVSR